MNGIDVCIFNVMFLHMIGWQADDPECDMQEFRGSAFQRAYQYLSQQPDELDHFEFYDEENDGKVLGTLLK